MMDAMEFMEPPALSPETLEAMRNAQDMADAIALPFALPNMRRPVVVGIDLAKGDSWTAAMSEMWLAAKGGKQ